MLSSRPNAGPVDAAGRFDHGAFDSLLRRHVRDGLVDYDAFARAPEFDAYLAALDAAQPARLDEPERLAFWLNTYNAYTIRLIVAHRERRSIRNINRGVGLGTGQGPWQERLVRAGGSRLSLDEVEHRIVRREFREPRIHFALVCAARSCPPLRSETYTGAQLERQLDDQTRRFLLESPQSNRVDPAGGVFHLSPIFIWYKEDFGGDDAALARFAARYFPLGAARELLESGRARLAPTPYDWSLNALPAGEAR